MLRMTLGSTPADATHRSTRAMAKRSGLSQTMIVRIWRAFGLQPHRVEGFKLSKDPLFIEKVREIVGLYLSMKRPRFRRSIAVSRSCRCDPAKPNVATAASAISRPIW
jgi:hypothetical protein